jgi:hydroxypyruvate reductase 2
MSGLGIVGLGQIGLVVAKRAEAFGCKISYLARAEKSELPYKFHATVLKLAKNSDVVVLTCGRGYNLFGASRFIQVPLIMKL